jgi:hypothetical protein
MLQESAASKSVLLYCRKFGDHLYDVLLVKGSRTLLHALHGTVLRSKRRDEDLYIARGHESVRFILYREL